MRDRTKIGSTYLHWAAYSDSLFLIKLFFRFSCDFSLKDNDDMTCFERATDNNSIKVVDFLLTYSTTVFHTNYFLFNQYDPTEFNYFPQNLNKTKLVYESPRLNKLFNFKKNPKKNILMYFKHLYSKNNLLYKFGLILYALWMLTSLFLITPLNEL